MEAKTNDRIHTRSKIQNWRKSKENILPQNLNQIKHTGVGYNIYPFHSLGSNKIFSGYSSLACWIVEQKTVIIEGYIGVFWEEVEQLLQKEFSKKDIIVNWIRHEEFLKGEQEINAIVKPFLGPQKSIWGKKTTLELSDFYYTTNRSVQPDPSFEINIVIGIGSGLVGWDVPVVYLDLPKNEIQYRMRGGSITNLGSSSVTRTTEMYKRLYFVDWVILNKHRASLLERIVIFGDVQHESAINWIFSKDLNTGLKAIARSVLRARPWFEAGAWGGHWLQDNIEGLNKDEVNYAWSFELIVPENGIVFESDGNLLEIPFDLLMEREFRAVLGKHAEVFGKEFPIRFDFLDTVDGGNLSVQCHPSVAYIQEQFGEQITQDETYYILDCKDDAKVFLGFQQDIDVEEFRSALIESQEQTKEIDIEKYVQVFEAKKHDLFLIPNGTVHSAGANNLVLEISATPYIFTFKMYDWMRMGLDGFPRPINIDHAFKNLNFERKGEQVKKELISVPSVIEKGEDWQIVHLPTHQQHFYDVYRIEFDTVLTIDTNDTCHILMLVEGTTLRVETKDGTQADFYYAETFVVPAASESYTLINTGMGRAKVIKAFVKEELNSFL